MRRIRREQLIYGLIWGFLAFAIGWGATWFVLPEGFFSDVTRWKMVSYMFLSANMVPLGVEFLPGLVRNVNLLTQYSEYQYLRAIPVITCIPAAILVGASIGHTRRGRYILENSISIVLGYAVTGIFVMIASDARPTVNSVLIIFLVVGGAIAVGSQVLNQLSGSFPLIGIASLGSIVIIGLLVIFGGFVIVKAVAPLVIIPAISGVIASILLWSSRNAPI